MDYTTMDYRQMLQILQSAKMCRVAATVDGAPCILLQCCRFFMDGCVPVLEMTVPAESGLPAALASAPAVMLEVSRATRAGTECVLLQGMATVQNAPQQPCCQSACRLRYGMPDTVCTMGGFETGCTDGCYTCGRRSSCMGGESCPRPGCIRQQPYPQQPVIIRVAADRMTGRCYSHCPDSCDQKY